jgi:hypothetical protein
MSKALSIIGLALAVLMITQGSQAQCVISPDGMTALKFNNQSSYELTFFIDHDEKVTLAPKTASAEFPVEPGDHILRARATIAGVSVWASMGNSVPEGQVCTWTVEDPHRKNARSANRYRTVFDANVVDPR